MKNFPKIFVGSLSLFVFAASVYGIFNRQQILDWLALRNYTPNQRVVTLADHTTMKEDTRRVFYVYHPELNSKQDFRGKCPSTEESIVLGCYVNTEGIFLLDVTDERLSGIIEVTAAHEVLHAHYDRLSSSERKRIDKLTAESFAQVTNERIKKTVEQYRAKDPSIVPNELHSILATEVRNLSPELEEYYKKYFSNRAKIVEFSEKYEQTFVSLSNQVEQYDEELKSLKQQIDSNQAEIEGLNKEIDSRRSQLDGMINSGNVNEYNEAVPGFNSFVNEYNSLIAETRRLIDRYNSTVEERNAIATTEQELIEAINSNILPKRAE